GGGGWWGPEPREPHQILRLQPDRQPPPVDRRVAEIADADAGHAQAVLERIERAERLAERLAHAVARVRAHVMVSADAARARVEADRMVRRCEPDALAAGARRRLEQVVAADDVGMQDRLPRSFDREPAEMNDAVDTVDRLLDRREVGEVGGDEVLVGAKVARGLEGAQPQMRIAPPDTGAHARP